MKERNYYLDFLRGIAAINIIIIHTAFWSGESYVPKIVQSITLMLDVPFFFFLSGWSFAYVKSNIKVFNGLMKIQKQYLFFLIVYSAILFIFSREDVSWNNFVFNFFYLNKVESKILPVVMGSIWFMPVYFSVALIFPTILSIIKNQKDKYAMLIIFCVCGIIFSQIGGNFFNISIQILFYGFFYVLGFVSEKYIIASFKALNIILIVIISLILVCKKIFLVDKIIVQNLKFPPNIIYLLLSLILIAVALYFKNKIIITQNNFISQIGSHAIFYYFGQGISSSLMFSIVKMINCRWEIKFFIVAVINVISSVLISEIIYKIYLIADGYLLKLLKKNKVTLFLKYTK